MFGTSLLRSCGLAPRLCAFALSFLCIAPAWADFACDVKITQVLVYGDGSVNVFHSVRNDYTVVCNLSAARNGVSPTTCAMWTAMLESIKKRAGTAAFWYSGDGSCTTIGTYWSAPAPTYIGDAY
jgi:hypothetical protein